MPPWCEGRAKCTVPNPHGLLDILSAGCPDIGVQKGPVTHVQAPMRVVSCSQRVWLCDTTNELISSETLPGVYAGGNYQEGTTPDSCSQSKARCNIWG